ncbi:MAG: hypothetical protein KDK24_15950 [Pseudooceanicola sp.]|nr:hypothetical protein [Pseudooceanicola sp.]
MTGPDKPRPDALQLDRQALNRRRLSDLARLLPLAGAGLLMVPVLWPGVPETAAGVAPVRTSQAVLYIFGCWLALIAIAVAFGVAVRRTDADGADGSGPG